MIFPATSTQLHFQTWSYATTKGKPYGRGPSLFISTDFVPSQAKTYFWAKFSAKWQTSLTSLRNIFDSGFVFYVQAHARSSSQWIIYFSHSRKKVKALYPDINAADVRSLYQTKNERHQKLERLDIPKFLLDTASVIKILVCQIGKLGLKSTDVKLARLIQPFQS